MRILERISFAEFPENKECPTIRRISRKLAVMALRSVDTIRVIACQTQKAGTSWGGPNCSMAVFVLISVELLMDLPARSLAFIGVNGRSAILDDVGRVLARKCGIKCHVTDICSLTWICKDAQMLLATDQGYGPLSQYGINNIVLKGLVHSGTIGTASWLDAKLPACRRTFEDYLKQT